LMAALAKALSHATGADIDVEGLKVTGMSSHVCGDQRARA